VHGIIPQIYVQAHAWNKVSGWISITGRLAQKFPELNKFFQASKEEVLALWDAFVMLFTDPLQFLDNLKGELLDALLWDGAGVTISLVSGHS
jgi:hypothetical protein